MQGRRPAVGWTAHGWTAVGRSATAVAVVVAAALLTSCGSTTHSGAGPTPAQTCDLLTSGVAYLVEPAWLAAGIAKGPETNFLSSALSYPDQQIEALRTSSAFWKSVRATVGSDDDLGASVDAIASLYDSSVKSLQETDGTKVFIPVSGAIDPDASGTPPPTGPAARRIIERYATEQCGIDLTAVPAGTALSKTEFVARANAACFQYDMDVQTKGDAVPTPTSQDRQAVLDYLHQLLTEVVDPASAVQVATLRALPPPAGDESTVTGLIDHLQQQVETMDHDPVAAVNELGKTASPSAAYQPAVDYGLLQCSTQ